MMNHKNVTFSLSEKFVDEYKKKTPKWGPLGYFTYKRTYARRLGDDSDKTEEWWQTVKRVIEGTFLIQKNHCKNLKLPWNERKSQRSAQEMFQRIFDFKFLPPGRGLDNMGTPYILERSGAPLNNCGFVSTEQIDTDFSAPFCWIMDMAMLGVGPGFDTKGRHKEVILKSPRLTSDVHFIEDSREGWVLALKRVLDSFVLRDTLPKEWDFSLIRPKGAIIRTFGGVAPGPEPLKQLIEVLIKELDAYVSSNSPVDSTLITDIMNHIGAAVVAGGRRRVAEIAFSEIDDSLFLNLKNYKEYADIIGDRPRWASNNSVMAEVGSNYDSISKLIAQNGEPGVIWLHNMQAYSRLCDAPDWKDSRVMGCNPCGEQSLESFELCNLVETFPVKHTSLEDYLKTLKYAFLYAKTVTLLNTHDERTNQVMMRNRRIGLSQSGIVENFAKIGIREHLNWSEKGYNYVKELDSIYSEWLCIPTSRKITSVKPSGTVSLLPGVTPGIHYPHSKYYIRRVRVPITSPLWEAMKAANYPVEPCANQPDYTMVVSFPVKEENFDRSKKDVSMWEQLELAAQMQAYWADNQVSVTVTFKKEEAKDIAHALSLYEKRLKAVSFLPFEDHGYVQAPYEEITEATYNEMVSTLKKPKLNFEIAKEFEYCDGDTCEIDFMREKSAEN